MQWRRRVHRCIARSGARAPADLLPPLRQHPCHVADVITAAAPTAGGLPHWRRPKGDSLHQWRHRVQQPGAEGRGRLLPARFFFNFAGIYLFFAVVLEAGELELMRGVG